MAGGGSGLGDSDVNESPTSCGSVKLPYVVPGVQAHLLCSPGVPREGARPPGRGPFQNSNSNQFYSGSGTVLNWCLPGDWTPVPGTHPTLL